MVRGLTNNAAAIAKLSDRYLSIYRVNEPVIGGYELLGSDDGKVAFNTPLATKHKFNGWADKFLGTPKEGLEDVYLTAKGKVSGVNGLQLTMTSHLMKVALTLVMRLI